MQKVGYAKLNLLSRRGYAIKQWFKNMGETEDIPLSSVVGVYDKMHPEDRQKVFDFYEKVLAGEEKDFRSEMRILKPGATNEWNWVRMNVVVTKFEPEHGEVEIIGINYDITELKETEAMLIEAKEKAETMDRLKSAFPGEYESRDTYTTQCDCRFLGPLGRYGRHGGTLRIHQDRTRE